MPMVESIAHVYIILSPSASCCPRCSGSQPCAVPAMQSKRKSSDAAPRERNSKRQQVQQPKEPVIRNCSDFTHIELPAGQAAVFTGRGLLQVLEGCLCVAGKLVSAECPPLPILGGGWPGSSLLLRAEESAAGVVKAIVQATTQQQQGAEAGFDVFEANDPQAPAPAAASHQWQQVAAALTAGAAARPDRPLVVALCGTKGVGKSAFSRLLSNNLLNAFPGVWYLDTDCGQPEFTTPGLVSLNLLQQPVLGPPHMHPQAPQLAFSLGDVSPQSDPEHFLRCIQQLQQWWQQHGSAAAAAAAAAAGGSGVPLPLVINTHGWIRGLGLDLLADLLSTVQPTHVVQIQATNSKKNLPAGVFWQCEPAEQPEIIQLVAAAAAGAAGSQQGVQQEQAQAQQQVRQARVPTAVEGRALQWLAWAKRASACSSAAGDPAAGPAAVASDGMQPPAAGSWDSADAFAAAAVALASCPPYEVLLSDVRIERHDAQLPSAQQLPYLLNCSLVALLAGHAAPAAPLSSSIPSAAATAAAEAEAVSAAPRVCLGMGLIRAVDARKGLLYLLTDVPEEQLEQVQVLQAGRLELPPSLLQSPQLQSPYLALFCLTGGASGAGSIKSRNNIQRVSLLAA